MTARVYWSLSQNALFHNAAIAILYRSIIDKEIIYSNNTGNEIDFDDSRYN